MAENASFMLVIAILGSEHSRANGTCKVFNVIFTVQRCNVRSTKGIVAGVANQVKSFEVVLFAQRILVWTLIGNREEFGRNNFVAFLSKTVN
jgi:hypothetical protein